MLYFSLSCLFISFPLSLNSKRPLRLPISIIRRNGARRTHDREAPRAAVMHLTDSAHYRLRFTRNATRATTRPMPDYGADMTRARQRRRRRQ